MASARLPSWLQLSPAVRAARQRRRPVVALESAVFTHGLPVAERLPVAAELEEAARQGGATSAVIALLDGKARVGLSPAQLQQLVSAPQTGKCARGDLGWLLAQRVVAGTTVSATIHIAAAAGIDVVATGGIGGVHRDVAESFDVSPDLIELTRARVVLVCSGAKTIVDLRKTLEFLETHAVPVIGWRTRTLPGFYVRETRLLLRAHVDTLTELARAVQSYRATGYAGAIVVANPVSPEDALPEDEVERLIAESLRQAAEQGVHGQAVTPFLLEAVNQRSRGATLRANKALLRGNARLAAQLAVALRRR